MKKTKYSTGTGKSGVVKNYMQDPHEVLAENAINISKAKSKAVADPLAMGTNILGNMAMQFGASQGGGNQALGMIQELFKFGGKVGTKGIEVEGDEVLETPDGQVFEAEGPKHEQGGIDVDAPIGTEIFADAIKRDGKTMAERKKAREKKLDKIMKALDKNPSDRVLKNSRDRVQAQNEAEEQEDLAIQQKVKTAVEQGSKQEYNTGTGPGGVGDPSTNPWLNPDILSGILGDGSGEPDVEGKTMIDPYLSDEGNDEKKDNPFALTGGDMMGLFGNLYTGFKGLQNTENQRATDTPHENHYEGFGEDALEKSNQSKEYADDSVKNLLMNIQRNATGSKRQNRIGSRGINTQRALDLATDQNVNKAMGDAHGQLADRMMQILGRESMLENHQDEAIARGEQFRDSGERADKDAYYSAKAQNHADIGLGIQQTGKDLNQAQQERMIAKIMSQMSKYGLTFDSNMNIVNSK